MQPFQKYEYFLLLKGIKPSGHFRTPQKSISGFFIFSSPPRRQLENEIMTKLTSPAVTGFVTL